MQRVKLFEAAHKGLRNALSQFSFMLGKADFSDKNDVNRLHSLGKDLFMMLSSHANDENTIILAELETKVPGSSKHDMDDHEWLEKEQDAIEKLLDEIKEVSAKGEDPSGMGSELYLKFEKFHGDYLIHTFEEETVTQHLLWDNFTDPEIHAMRGKIISRFTPETFEKWQSYIMPSITHKDLFTMFSGIRANAPEQFEKLMTMAEKYLQKEEFTKLKTSLG
jgi:hypothetical protein